MTRLFQWDDVALQRDHARFQEVLADRRRQVGGVYIQRLERPAGDWQDVTITTDSETTLVDQPRGKEVEFRIIAVNKAGEGVSSNTVMAVFS